ncbi:DMT family transporter [Sphingosinicella sp. LHD-64]|uniref:DMT family transporter n=1 Tax=Sphingosinicella sp. LHD-64 TaxID=3072139 RepID=UPI00280E71E7|nr:DMT family transporter [Sphingosinicella sp. LHD-64]MDQ8756292.1 DMT family transporter [Sphingosinicella sp. LHD-64]
MSAAGSFRDPKVLVPFLLVTLIWSSTWIVIKDQIGPVPSPWSVTYRFLIGAAAMFVIAAATGARLAIGREGHVLAALLGTAQFGLNFNFVYAAEHYVTSGLVAVVFALLMVPNALFARIFFDQRVGRRFLAGSAVALVGVALLFVQEARASAASSAATLTGIGFTLLGVLCASAANVMQLSERVKARPLVALLAWAMLYGAILDAAVAFALYGAPVAEGRIGYWAGLFYLGLIGSALTFPLYFDVIRRIGPGKAAYSAVLIPILAMAISTVAEGYRWSPLAAAGGMLAILGLVIALRAGRPAAETARG